MNTAYLLTGANLGNRQKSLRHAHELLGQQCGQIIAASRYYETAAWGKTDQPNFLNQALAINTKYSANELIGHVLDIEKQMGRTRVEKYGPRLIDIDILLFNQEIHQLPALTIPHPQLHNRRFALVPLAGIAPDFIHPVFQKTIRQLLTECPDPLEVHALDDY